jgi:hypothetical protein
MANKYMRKCSTSIAIKETQIKITLRFHLTSQKGYHHENKLPQMLERMWERCGGEGTLIYGWWECKLVRPLRKSVWRIL